MYVLLLRVSAEPQQTTSQSSFFLKKSFICDWTFDVVSIVSANIGNNIPWEVVKIKTSSITKCEMHSRLCYCYWTRKNWKKLRRNIYFSLNLFLGKSISSWKSIETWILVKNLLMHCINLNFFWFVFANVYFQQTMQYCIHPCKWRTVVLKIRTIRIFTN